MGTLMKWLRSQAGGEDRAERMPQDIGEIRRRSLQAIADCTRPHDERIRLQLARAATAQQLWLARSDIYAAVAHQHCEAEAMRRVNELVDAFEGWLPPSAITRL